VRVQVTAANAAGEASASSEQSAQVAAVPPANTALPTISGTAQDGQTLAADPGSWSGSAPIAYVYQWQRCSLGLCVDILGASGESYQLTAADLGSTIRVQVTGSNTAGEATQSSDPTSIVLLQ
jgi:hypothetical protein